MIQLFFNIFTAWIENYIVMENKIAQKKTWIAPELKEVDIDVTQSGRYTGFASEHPTYGT